MSKPHQELIAKEGWIFLFPPLLLGLLALFFGISWLAALLLVLAAYVAYFFRNPYRQIPDDPNVLVSPADGKVVAVRKMEDGRQFVAIFLNIFNVHINRSPIEGTVERIDYQKGLFLVASHEDASTKNERNTLVIRDGDYRIELSQVAGLIARRIVCWSAVGDQLRRGERFGLIRFGSRVDLILPAETQVLVKPGQKIRGGSDVIARRG